MSCQQIPAPFECSEEGLEGSSPVHNSEPGCADVAAPADVVASAPPSTNPWGGSATPRVPAAVVSADQAPVAADLAPRMAPAGSPNQAPERHISTPPGGRHVASCYTTPAPPARDGVAPAGAPPPPGGPPKFFRNASPASAPPSQLPSAIATARRHLALASPGPPPAVAKLLWDPFQRLPDALVLHIFAALPPADVAASCALVSRQWSRLAADAQLWQAFCSEHNLSEEDAAAAFGGWRGLYGTIFGTNLVASPCFAKLAPEEGRDGADARGGDDTWRWSPRHRRLLDRLWTQGDRHEGFACLSSWSLEGPAPTYNNNEERSYSLRRELVPEGCPLCPAGACAAARLPPAVVATARDWGFLQQYIGVGGYGQPFLDSRPGLQVSAWYAGHVASAGHFRVKLTLRDRAKAVLLTWDSSNVRAVPGEWRKLTHTISSCPEGVVDAILKVGGTAVELPIGSGPAPPPPPPDGFVGPRFTAVRLSFVPRREALRSAREGATWPSQHAWDDPGLPGFRALMLR